MVYDCSTLSPSAHHIDLEVWWGGSGGNKSLHPMLKWVNRYKFNRGYNSLIKPRRQLITLYIWCGLFTPIQWKWMQSIGNILVARYAHKQLNHHQYIHSLCCTLSVGSRGRLWCVCVFLLRDLFIFISMGDRENFFPSLDAFHQASKFCL